MRDIYEVLRLKEQQAEQLEKEIEALRLAIKILDESEVAGKNSESRNGASVTLLDGTYAATGNSPKRFP